MAADCEKLKLTVTGYDCLNLIHALNVWIGYGVTEESENELSSLRSRIENQYNETKREASETETDEKIKKRFSKAFIGELFVAHGCLWVKTARSVGTSIPRTRYGSCNFDRDPEDEFVESIDGEKIEQLLNGGL
jgi:hypothetical protein